MHLVSPLVYHLHHWDRREEQLSSDVSVVEWEEVIGFEQIANALVKSLGLGDPSSDTVSVKAVQLRSIANWNVPEKAFLYVLSGKDHWMHDENRESLTRLQEDKYYELSPGNRWSISSGNERYLTILVIRQRQ